MPSRAGALPSGRMPTRLRFGPTRQLVLDAPRAGKAALDPPPLLDRPGERRFNGARGLVDVVAVEAKPRLQAQRVARAEADGLHARRGQQQLGEVRRLRRRHRNLEPVLPGVAGSRDVAVEVADTGAGRLHEAEPRGRRALRRHDPGSGRPLHGKQRPLGRRLQSHAGGQAARDVGIVHLLARGVDDQEQPAVLIGRRRPRHHQVVDDAAVLVEQLGIALLAGPKPANVGGHECLQRRRRGRVIRPGQKRLPHVRDIEQAGLRARVQMLLQDAQRVLHGHLVAGERHHLGAERHVQLVERGALQGLVGNRSRAHARASHVPQGLTPAPAARVQAPSVTGPERFQRGPPALPLR